MRKYLLLGLLFLTGTFLTNAQYCDAGPTNANDSNIEAISIIGEDATEIDYTGCPGIIGVEDLTAQSVDLTPGQTYTIDVTFGTCGGNYGGAGQVWIDFNQDEIFETGVETLGSSSGTPGTAPWNDVVQFTFLVPLTAEPGATRMRVTQDEGGVLPLDPCETFIWGSVIDYTVNIEAITFDCQFPTAIVADVLSDTEVELTWDGGGEAEWNIEYGVVGFDPGAGEELGSFNVTTTTFLISDLDANTEYGFSIQAVCTAENSFWNTVTATTACGIESAPFFENFDGSSWVSGAGFNNAGDQFNPCWERTPDGSPAYSWGTRTGTTASNFSTGPSGDFSGTGNYVFVETGNGVVGNEAIFSTPLIDVNSLTTPALSFYYHMRGADIGTLIVEAKEQDDTDWTEVFTVVGQQQSSAVDPWEQAIVSLAGFELQVIQLRFRTTRLGFNGDLAVDEISVIESPTCFNVLDLVTDNTSFDSATVSWTDYPDATDGFIWEVYLSETVIEDNEPLFEGLLTAGETSFTVTGLDADTSYVFVLISDCGADNGQSFQNSIVEFSTACDVFAAPFSENFDGSDWATGAGFNNAGDQINQCWSRIPDGSPNYSWGTRTGTTGSTFATGPSSDFSGAGNYLFVEASSGAVGDEAIFTSPLIDVSALTTPATSFYYHMRGVDIDVLTVEAKEDGTSDWIEVFTITGPQQLSAIDSWEQAIVSLAGFEQQIIQVRFRTSKLGFNGDVAIDNFLVDEAPTCFNVTGFSVAPAVTTADASWDEIPSATDGYTLEVYNDGEVVGVDVPFVSEDIAQNLTTFEITGLTEAQTYIATITSNCGVAGLSDTIQVTFTTVSLGDTCEAAIVVDSIPYTTTDDTANYSDFYNGAPGTNCGATAGYLGGNDVVYSYTPDEDMVVLVSMNPTNTWSGIFVYDTCDDIGTNCLNGIGNNNTDIREFEVILEAGEEYIFVISTWPAPQTTAYTFELTQVLCGAVGGLNTTFVGSDQIDYAWDAVPGALNYDWIVVLAGDDPEEAGDIVASGDTVDTFVSVVNLASSANYDFYVRSECNGDVFGNLTGPLNIQTECVAEPVPTSNEDFSNATFDLNTSPDMPCWSEATGLLPLDGTDFTATVANGSWGPQNYANDAANPNGTAMYINLFGDGNHWFISQQIDLGDNTDDDLVVQYDRLVIPWFGSDLVTDMGQHQVHVVVSTDGGSTWNSDDIIATYEGDDGDVPTISATEFISLSGYSGIIKIGFYALEVTTTPDLRFYFDNFRILPSPTCFAPQGFTVTEIGLDSALANWDLNPDATEGYVIEVYNSGDQQGVDIPVFQQILGNDIDSILIDGLIDGSDYEVYLFSDCGDVDGVSVSAEISFTTANIGDTCEAAIQIEDLPYSSSDSTSNYDNNYSGAPGTDCGTTTAYLNQNDVVYSYIAEENGGLDITLTNIVGTYASVFVYDSCGAIGNFCLDGGVNPFVGGAQPDIELIEVPVVAGEEYFIVISHWFGTNVDYTLEIDFVSCSRPNNLDTETVGAGVIELSWNATGNETQWEVEYGLGLSPLGDIDNVRVIVDQETLVLDDLVSSTNYRFWVRGVCDLDNEEYSAWVGPQAFRSPIVPILIAPSTSYNEVYCYGNFEFTEWLFVSDAEPLEEIIMEWNTGSIEDLLNSNDVLKIYDGFSEDGILLWDTDIDGSDLSGLFFQATSGAFYLILTTDLVQSCEGGQGELPVVFDFDVFSQTFSTDGFGKDEFSFYPNPVESSLNIQSANLIESYELFNMSGQRLKNDRPNTNSPSINMHDLPAGVYLMKVTIGGISETFQVIKR